MPRWDVHDKWAEKLSISGEISNYINRAADNRDMPEDFKKHTRERKIPMSRGKSQSIGSLTFLFGKNLHDRGKLKFAKEQDLQFLSKKGTDYVKTWYLHFILDYLVALRDWRKNTGENIEDCIGKYQKNKAVTVLDTKEQLVEVMSFLKENSEELAKDIESKSLR